MVTFFISRILGIVREMAVNNYGMGDETDAYYAAFQIPDIIYTVLVGGALSTAFIPVYGKYIAKKEYDDAYDVASTIWNLTAIFATAMAIIGAIFAPFLVGLMVEYEGEKLELTIKLTRIMFIQAFTMCMTGIAQGILQTHKKFSVPAIGSIIYNITIIVFGVKFYQYFGMAAYSIGVVLGAVLNLAIQLPYVAAFKYKHRFVLKLKHPGTKRFFMLAIPAILGLAMSEVNLLVNTYFASSLGKRKTA